jgi:exosortase/archaeosortase family protein
MRAAIAERMRPARFVKKALPPKVWSARLGPASRFAVSFVLIAAVLFALYFFPYAERGGSEAWFNAYLAQYARAVALVVGCFERGITVAGNIVSGRFRMSIIKSCDGMETNILFCAATLAFPGAWRRKWIALPVGLAALVAFNVLRLSCLYFIGVFFPSAFEFAHFDVWPLFLVSFALVDFLLCANWVQRGGRRASSLALGTGHGAP